MNSHAAVVLGFDRLLGVVASEAKTPQGRDACLEIEAARSPARARELLDELEAFSNLVEELGYPPLDGVTRVEEFLERSRTPGACLDVESLMEVGRTTGVLVGLIEYLEDAKKEGSPIGDMAEGLKPLYVLEKRFARTFGPDGRVLDTASPELAAIRDEQKRLRQRVLKTLSGILKAQEFDHVVQDDFVTERSNRFVIPLTTNFKGYLKGIVHDHSRTGQTVFVEPFEVVETNNRFNESKEEEAAEIRRILVSLTAEVGVSSRELTAQILVAASVDRLAAKQRLIKRLDMTRPEISDSPVLEIGGARHPLLELRDGVEVVPIDVRLGGEKKLLLITGANAGGKTVALKTAGLMTLMAHSGMYIPAVPGSVVGWFPEVLADIGDEQDIDRDLSTFSAHMARLKEIFEGCGEGSLVLLDEMGTGTDPDQGTALSVAVLEELNSMGAGIIATTHLDGLKIFVYSVPWGMNAAVAFDPGTGRPLYRLHYGHAGSSNALDVARRMGIPDRVLDRARRFAGEGGGTLAGLLNDLEAALVTARRKEEESEKLGRKLKEEVERQKVFTEETKRERQGAREEARKEAREMIRRMREELKTAIEAMREDRLERSRAQALVDGVAAEVERRFPRPVAESGKPLPPEAMVPGASVYVRSLGKEGQIAEKPSSGKVRVRVGGIVTTVSADELFSSADSAKKAPRPAKGVSIGRVAVDAERSSPDVVLIGMTVEEAMEELDRAVNRAFVTGIERFKVVHGRGSGALRRAVRKRISDDPKRLKLMDGDSDDAVTWIETT